MIDDFDLSFSDHQAWADWRASHHGSLSEQQISAIATSIGVDGFVEPLTEWEARPGSIVVGKSFREGLKFQGINARARAVMFCIAKALDRRPASGVRIYAAEGLTSFAGRMRGLFPRFLGSEYGRTPEEISRLYPIPSEDLSRLSLPDSTFDITSTNEVLEHVPDLDACLRELVRVTRPGGWYIGTIPFAFNRAETRIHAEIRDGEIVHHVPPEYHGNPTSPAEGSLVYRTPAWDILGSCRAAGFSHAEMRCILSRKFGIVCEGSLGMFVLVCRR